MLTGTVLTMRCRVTGDEDSRRENKDRPDAPRRTDQRQGERAPQADRAPLPRYQPPAPYPPPANRVPVPTRPANAVPGYVPPTGAVWAPPARPAAPRRPASPAAPPPLRMLVPTNGPAWTWKQSVWGLLLGMGPFVALYAATYSLTDSVDTSIDDVTLVTAVVYLVSSTISYGWQIFSAWLFSVRAAAHKLRAWGFRRPTSAFFWTIPAVLLAAYATSYVNDALLNPPEQDIVNAFPLTAGGILLFTVVAVVMAPFAEEIFFRGFLYKGFETSWGWVRGAAVSGAVFSLAHLQVTLFAPLFVLGFGLAWVYRRTGSLWTSIALHATFNGLAVLAWALTS